MTPGRPIDVAAARLQSLLRERGLQDSGWTFQQAWDLVREWVRSDDRIHSSTELALGFECSFNPNAPWGTTDHPTPPEGLEGPLFNVVFLWDFESDGEAGVELWYAADPDWETVTRDPEWDPQHPVNYHLWGYPGVRSDGYVRDVEGTPCAQVAATKKVELARVFCTGAPDFVYRRPVSDAPPLLTRELLDALEARWRAQRAPLVPNLRPGLTVEEMAAIVAPLELTVPAEAQTWFGWHDGATSHGLARDTMMTGLGWAFFSLERAVEEAQERRQMALEAAGENAERWLWRWGWLPLADNFHGGAIIVDGRTAPQTPATPVLYTEPEVGARDVTPGAASLGQMVTWWIEAMDQHLIDYDAAAGEWRYDGDRIDPERERTRLV